MPWKFFEKQNVQKNVKKMLEHEGTAIGFVNRLLIVAVTNGENPPPGKTPQSHPPPQHSQTNHPMRNHSGFIHPTKTMLRENSQYQHNISRSGPPHSPPSHSPPSHLSRPHPPASRPPPSHPLPSRSPPKTGMHSHPSSNMQHPRPSRPPPQTGMHPHPSFTMHHPRPSSHTRLPHHSRPNGPNSDRPYSQSPRHPRLSPTHMMPPRSYNHIRPRSLSHHTPSMSMHKPPPANSMHRPPGGSIGRDHSRINHTLSGLHHASFSRGQMTHLPHLRNSHPPRHSPTVTRPRSDVLISPTKHIRHMDSLRPPIKTTEKPSCKIWAPVKLDHNENLTQILNISSKMKFKAIKVNEIIGSQKLYCKSESGEEKKVISNSDLLNMHCKKLFMEGPPDTCNVTKVKIEITLRDSPDLHCFMVVLYQRPVIMKHAFKLSLNEDNPKFKPSLFVNSTSVSCLSREEKDVQNLFENVVCGKVCMLCKGPGNIMKNGKEKKNKILHYANNLTLNDEISFAPIDENQQDVIECDLKIICNDRKCSSILENLNPYKPLITYWPPIIKPSEIVYNTLTLKKPKQLANKFHFVNAILRLPPNFISDSPQIKFKTLENITATYKDSSGDEKELLLNTLMAISSLEIKLSIKDINNKIVLCINNGTTDWEITVHFTAANECGQTKVDCTEYHAEVKCKNILKGIGTEQEITNCSACMLQPGKLYTECKTCVMQAEDKCKRYGDQPVDCNVNKCHPVCNRQCCNGKSISELQEGAKCFEVGPSVLNGQYCRVYQIGTCNRYTLKSGNDVCNMTIVSPPNDCAIPGKGEYGKIEGWGESCPLGKKYKLFCDNVETETEVELKNTEDYNCTNSEDEIEIGKTQLVGIKCNNLRLDSTYKCCHGEECEYNIQAKQNELQMSLRPKKADGNSITALCTDCSGKSLQAVIKVASCDALVGPPIRVKQMDDGNVVLTYSKAVRIDKKKCTSLKDTFDPRKVMAEKPTFTVAGVYKLPKKCIKAACSASFPDTNEEFNITVAPETCEIIHQVNCGIHSFMKSKIIKNSWRVTQGDVKTDLIEQDSFFSKDFPSNINQNASYTVELFAETNRGMCNTTKVINPDQSQKRVELRMTSYENRTTFHMGECSNVLDSDKPKMNINMPKGSSNIKTAPPRQISVDSNDRTIEDQLGECSVNIQQNDAFVKIPENITFALGKLQFGLFPGEIEIVNCKTAKHCTVPVRVMSPPSEIWHNISHTCSAGCEVDGNKISVENYQCNDIIYISTVMKVSTLQYNYFVNTTTACQLLENLPPAIKLNTKEETDGKICQEVDAERCSKHNITVSFKDDVNIETVERNCIDNERDVAPFSRCNICLYQQNMTAGREYIIVIQAKNTFGTVKKEFMLKKEAPVKCECSNINGDKKELIDSFKVFCHCRVEGALEQPKIKKRCYQIFQGTYLKKGLATVQDTIEFCSVLHDAEIICEAWVENEDKKYLSNKVKVVAERNRTGEEIFQVLKDTALTDNCPDVIINAKALYDSEVSTRKRRSLSSTSCPAQPTQEECYYFTQPISKLVTDDNVDDAVQYVRPTTCNKPCSRQAACAIVHDMVNFYYQNSYVERDDFYWPMEEIETMVCSYSSLLYPVTTFNNASRTTFRETLEGIQKSLCYASVFNKSHNIVTADYINITCNLLKINGPQAKNITVSKHVQVMLKESFVKYVFNGWNCEDRQNCTDATISIATMNQYITDDNAVADPLTNDTEPENTLLTHIYNVKMFADREPFIQIHMNNSYELMFTLSTYTNNHIMCHRYNNPSSSWTMEGCQSTVSANRSKVSCTCNPSGFIAVFEMPSYFVDPSTIPTTDPISSNSQSTTTRVTNTTTVNKIEVFKKALIEFKLDYNYTQLVLQYQVNGTSFMVAETLARNDICSYVRSKINKNITGCWIRRGSVIVTVEILDTPSNMNTTLNDVSHIITNGNIQFKTPNNETLVPDVDSFTVNGNAYVPTPTGKPPTEEEDDDDYVIVVVVIVVIVGLGIILVIVVYCYDLKKTENKVGPSPTGSAIMEMTDAAAINRANSTNSLNVLLDSEGHEYKA